MRSSLFVSPRPQVGDLTSLPAFGLDSLSQSNICLFELRLFFVCNG